jgi:HEAT repeat protein
LRRLFELLRGREKEKSRNGARRFVRLFFFVVFVVLCITQAVFSQNLGELARVLHSGNTDEKRTVLLQLRSLRSEEASRIAVAALSDSSPIVRATAASSVTFLPQAEAAQALLPLVKDKDEFVRREGVSALGDVGDPSSAPELMSLLLSDKSQEVRSAAAVAIGKVGNPVAIDALIKVLGQQPTEDNEMFRRAAARSIGQIAQIMRGGAKRVVTPENFLPEKYKDVDNKPSADLLSHFQVAVTTLIRVLESSGEADDARREAAFALGAIGDRRAETVLSKYSTSTDPYLAEISKEALLKLRAVE